VESGSLIRTCANERTYSASCDRRIDEWIKMSGKRGSIEHPPGLALVWRWYSFVPPLCNHPDLAYVDRVKVVLSIVQCCHDNFAAAPDGLSASRALSASQ
jgi:hypothetical protein